MWSSHRNLTACLTLLAQSEWDSAEPHKKILQCRNIPEESPLKEQYRELAGWVETHQACPWPDSSRSPQTDPVAQQTILAVRFSSLSRAWSPNFGKRFRECAALIDLRKLKWKPYLKDHWLSVTEHMKGNIECCHQKTWLPRTALRLSCVQNAALKQ